MPNIRLIQSCLFEISCLPGFNNMTHVDSGQHLTSTLYKWYLKWFSVYLGFSIYWSFALGIKSLGRIAVRRLQPTTTQNWSEMRTCGHNLAFWIWRSSWFKRPKLRRPSMYHLHFTYMQNGFMLLTQCARFQHYCAFICLDYEYLPLRHRLY